MRLFYDDLEDALHNKLGARPNLDEQTLSLYKAQLSDYLVEHLIIEGETRGIRFLVDQLARNQDIVIVHLSGIDPWPETSLSITNDVLIEIYGTQKNVMTIRLQDDIDTLAFSKKNRRLKLNL